MPDNTSSFDDPLADLYGKLPDPGSASRDTDSGAISSRRAARAARGDTGETEAQPEPQRADLVGASAPGARIAGTTRTASSGTGTLDDLFSGRTSIDEVGTLPPPAEKRRRRLGGWIALLIVLAIVGGITVGGFWAANTFGAQIQGIFAPEEREDFEPGIAQGETTITVVSGDAGPQVSKKLFEAGVTKSSDSFYDYLIDTSTSFTFQPGVFKLQQQMNSAAVVEALREPGNRLANSARIREGLTLEQTVALLAEQMAMPVEDFQAAVADPAAYGVAAPSLEGWLFPATYEFNPGTPAKDVIARMVARTVESLDAAGVPEGDRQRILIIASIIEREVRLPDDFYKVSRVIQNRLQPGNQETFGKLQMDSTAQYGFGEDDGTASTSEEAQFNDNPWNTYRYPGLPVGPISNPGDLAIKAALEPADGPWIYFTTVNFNTGETAFSATYAEHQRAIVQMQEWCRNNPGSGC